MRSVLKAAFRSTAWLLMGATFAACGSATPSQGRVVCPLLVIAPPALLYPTNGATNVSKNDLQIILANAFGSTLTLTSAASGSVSTQAGKPAPNPLPPGSASPDPGASPIAYGVPTLAGSATYTVTGSFGGGPPCPSPTLSVGSFTTAP